MRVEQRDDTPGKWIAGRETLGFVAIAGRATQAQIVKLSAASGTARKDVVYLKGNPHHLLGTQAIRASVLRSGQDGATKRLRDTGHGSRFEQV
jgi:hypothetical protein